MSIYCNIVASHIYITHSVSYVPSIGYADKTCCCRPSGNNNCVIIDSLQMLEARFFAPNCLCEL